MVLSEDCARAIAHLRVIKALEEFEITPSIIAGTSAGDILAAFYSAGYKPEDIVYIALNGKFFNISNLLLK